MKKSNSQTIVVLTGDSVIDDGSVVIEQEAESEEQSGESVIKHSTPVAVRVKKQDLSEEVSRPTRGAAAAEAEEAAAVVEAEMVDAAEPEHDEGDQEVVSTKPTRGRATRASAVSKVEETDAGDEDGSSPTRKSTRARK